MDKTDPDLMPTRDHFPVPKSMGGRKTLIACSWCNHIKGDMTADQWHAYMAAHPEWWLQTREERRAMRRANRERERTERWGLRKPRTIQRYPDPPSTPMADALVGLRAAADLGRAFDETFGGKTED